MNYKLIEDKNGTIVLNEKRYKMSKLEYTKDDLIDIQNDYDLLYKKLDYYNKIINTQALEIARLKERIEININAFLYQSKRIDKAIEYIKENFDKTGECVSGSDLPYSYIEDLLEILGEKENE